MGAIKIKGATSGSTTITAPATGSDESIELSTALASKLPYSYGTATPSTTDSGFLWYDSNSTPAAPKFWDGAAFQALTSGKILQVVRDTDTSSRSTTSTSAVDVTGVSVTITPQKSDSAVLLIVTARIATINSTVDQARSQFLITDSSNNAISGAELHQYGFTNLSGSSNREMTLPMTLIAYATPATTSAVTYKLRFFSFSVSTTTTSIRGDLSTTQMFAVEVAA